MVLKRNNVIVISVVVVSLMAIAGVLYYANKKIDKESIRTYAVKFLKTKLPNAKVSIGEIDIKMGLSVKLLIKEVGISLQDKGKYKRANILNVQDIKVTIPITTLILDGDRINISLTKPILHYDGSSKISNFMHVAGKLSGSGSSKEKSKNIYLPPIITSSKININVKDMFFSYILSNNSEGDVLVRELKIKNLSPSGRIAYELVADISSTKAKTPFSTGLTLIGQVDARKLLDDGDLSVTSIAKVQGLEIPNRNIKTPKINADLRFNLSRDNGIDGNISSTINESNNISANFKLHQSSIHVSGIDVDMFMKDMAYLFNLDTHRFKFGQSKIVVNGEVKVSPNGNILPNITFEVGPKVSYSNGHILLDNNIKGKYRGSSFTLNTTSRGMGGNIYGDLGATVDINSNILKLSKLPPFKINIDANGIKLDRKKIASILYDNQKVGEKTAKKSNILLPRGKIKLTWEKFSIAGEGFSGDARISIGGRDITSEKIRFRFSKGSGNLESKTSIYKDTVRNTFSLQFDKLKADGLNAFFPPSVKEVSGILSGKIKGSLNIKDNLKDYNIFSILDIYDGKVKGVNLKKHTKRIEDILYKVPTIKERLVKSPIELNGNFKHIHINGRFTNNAYSMKKFVMVDDENIIKIDGKGVVYPPTAKRISNITMGVNISHVRKFAKKNFGTEIIPIKLSGYNFSLKPDARFTQTRLLKGLLKSKRRKYKEKSADKLNNKLKEAFKNKASPDKVKGLLKGLL